MAIFIKLVALLYLFGNFQGKILPVPWGSHENKHLACSCHVIG